MLLKVKHEELNNVSRVIKKDSEELDKEIDNLLEQVEILRTIWQGQDADSFCQNTSDYFSKMKSIPNCMRNISGFINNVDNTYKEKDEAFNRELRTEVDNYE